MSLGQIFYVVQLRAINGGWDDESRHRKKAAAIKAYEKLCRAHPKDHDQIRLVLCEVLS